MIDLRSVYPNTYDRRPLDAISTVVYHHSTGDIPTDEDGARRLLDVIYREHAVNRGWPGIGYGYAISPLGETYRLNDLESISNHVSDHNRYTVGVVFLGDYSDSAPSDAALWAASRLHYSLEIDLGRQLAVVGHAELNPASSEFCPSKKWHNWKLSIIRRIRQTPEVRVLPYLDTAWGLVGNVADVGDGVAADLDVLAAKLEEVAGQLRSLAETARGGQAAAAQIRDYLLLIKRGAGLT